MAGQFVAGDILLNGNVVIDGPSVLLSTDAGDLGVLVLYDSPVAPFRRSSWAKVDHQYEIRQCQRERDVQLTPVMNTAGGAFLQSLCCRYPVWERECAE
ncbi:MAG: hypothetical protein R3C56_19485 [Pirellulaceae bacterium]